MAPSRYETVIGLNKGHKVTKNNYQNRPSSKKGVSILFVCFWIEIKIFFPIHSPHRN